ncbi:uncharacterized protein LOC115225229 [Octopus sinensis]|uniref:Uncharacterized protein LOC115225229 n=1 Tax=Octopus sinensis TaxID=2607531 RepID=A0A6P7TKS7_9MOLL|nr:uncharacterized protein LOC115225229 [Octopus sinensis]
MASDFQDRVVVAVLHLVLHSQSPNCVGITQNLKRKHISAYSHATIKDFKEELSTSTSSTSFSSYRAFFVKDLVSKKYFMVDTGSCCSIWPLRLTTDRPKRSNVTLQAIDSSPIATFGQITLRLGIHLRRDFQWVFVIADIPHPILGADFLNNFDLLVDVRRRRLVDGSTTLSTPTRESTDSALSPTFFVSTSGDVFHSLLASFPELLDITFKMAKPVHSTFHLITTTGQPVFSRPRHLAPDRLKTARAEFEHMLQLGLIRPSTSPWA